MVEYTIKDIYISYRRAQSTYLNRPWRMPKDWSVFFNKMNKKNKEDLEKITTNFCTLWVNLNPDLYFKCGFELFGKNFAYHKFFDDKLFKYYTDKLKSTEIKAEQIEITIKETIDFLLRFCKKRNMKLQQYMDLIFGTGGLIPAILVHWRRKKIDPYTMIFLMGRYKEIFKSTEKQKIDLYLGKDFVTYMYRWRKRLIDRPDIQELLKTEIYKLERL